MDELRDGARQLLESLKGIERARVEVNARGRIMRVEISPRGIDDKSAVRNAQSALMAVLGQNIDQSAISIAAQVQEAPAPKVVIDNVVELRPGMGARKPDLHDAAKVAFDTLRAAQSSFHGFQFDGAELVKISGLQYVVVAVRKGSSGFCGAAPVVEGVAAASAKALMNAVGVAAMGATHIEISNGDFDVAIS
ncbi:MAG TPA: hypothetical protein VM100_10420 [Longimicrobiales bacterium]|nr:hypothetical protein [Longimicrobiales bacterium]